MPYWFLSPTSKIFRWNPMLRPCLAVLSSGDVCFSLICKIVRCEIMFHFATGVLLDRSKKINISFSSILLDCSLDYNRGRCLCWCYWLYNKASYEKSRRKVSRTTALEAVSSEYSIKTCNMFWSRSAIRTWWNDFPFWNSCYFPCWCP